MAVSMRDYCHETDYESIGEFLVRTHLPYALHHNWLQPRWEYMHYHPLLKERGLDLSRCGIWEEDDRIVGVVHFEHRMGIVYLQVDPGYLPLRFEMLDQAEIRLVGDLPSGRGVCVYIEDRDVDLQEFATTRGYEAVERWAEPMTAMDIPDSFPPVRINEPYRLQSLADEFDPAKIHRVIHRGFDHEGEPPEDELGLRKRKLSAPSFRRDLTIVAVAPDGSYASFCGIWLDAVNSLCYVEPVATDPDHRRKGLGKAVVLEAIRRCGAEAARIAYVGSDLPIYRSIGFRPVYRQTPWMRLL